MSYTPIKLDKVRNFRFGMKAIHQIEKAFKKPVSKVDFDNLTMEDTATIIWAGLAHEDKELTPDKVMELIDEHSSIHEVITKMGEAFNDSMGTGESNKGANEEKN